MAHPALSFTDHRPWVLPERPWVLEMNWDDLLFLHWPVSAAALQERLPRGLEVDTFDGAAWVGVVPFFMRMRFRGLPPLPGGHRFPELNLRSYVRHGDR
ncbi:MAG: DUF2071 domain-containing protein, partial [Planctomycetes bacterium]|nr:DUF2071 domain-containing protein [Planctomycetota bacterium]